MKQQPFSVPSEIGTRHMFFYLIIKGLSATGDGLGRESTDRFAPVNHQNGFSEQIRVGLRMHHIGIFSDNQFEDNLRLIFEISPSRISWVWKG